MTKRKQGSETQPREPEQPRTRVIFIRTTEAMHDAAKEVAANSGLSLNDLAEDSLAEAIELHNPNKPRTIVAQVTVALHEAAKEAAARRNLSLDEYMEDALLTAVELPNPNQGTASDVNEKTAGQKTGIETQGQGRR